MRRLGLVVLLEALLLVVAVLWVIGSPGMACIMVVAESVLARGGQNARIHDANIFSLPGIDVPFSSMVFHEVSTGR